MSVLLAEARRMTDRLGQVVSQLQDIIDVDPSEEQEIDAAAPTPTDD